MCNIFNKSISTGVFPDSLKVAKVVPLYKKNTVSKILIITGLLPFCQFSPNYWKKLCIVDYLVFSKNMKF